MPSSKNDALLANLGGDDLQLWSPSLQTHRKPAEVLADRIVLIYFSASWCPPCARFSPILKSLYKKLKADDGKEDFELIFASLDKTQESYDRYTANMPWYCLPFQSPVMGKLASLYAGGQLSIPRLVVLDADGSVLVADGVGEVSADPDGANFPWRPKPVKDLLPEHYIASDDKTTLCPVSDLDDKYLMLYFSAHWCPPCKAFTPKLSKAYRELKQARGDDFELLFVSSDRSEAAFNEYFAEMSFGAIPYHEREAKAALSSRLQVRGIPTLMIFGPVPSADGAGGGDRPLINGNVRGCIESGNAVADFPFAPKRYGDLNASGEDINATRCVVVFHEGGDDEEQGDVEAALAGAAEQCRDDDNKALKFFWALAPSGMAKAVREALQLGPIKDEPVMVLLDIPDRGAYYVSDQTDISVDAVLGFVENPGERKQL